MSARSRSLPPHVLPAIALTFLVALSAPACAVHASYRVPPSPRVINTQAFNAGYREGFEHGRDDGRRGRAFDYSRHREYRDLDGYRGDRNAASRRLYRDGFAEGYNDAYRQFARDNRRQDRNDRRGQPDPDARSTPGADRRGRFGSPAAENGFRDGYAQGRDDARDRDRSDPIRARAYREGDRGYNDRYGSRDQYARDYREAFKQGYDQGYREERR